MRTPVYCQSVRSTGDNLESKGRSILWDRTRELCDLMVTSGRQC